VFFFKTTIISSGVTKAKLFFRKASNDIKWQQSFTGLNAIGSLRAIIKIKTRFKN